MLRELVSIAFLCCPVPAMAADPAEEREKLEGAWTAISAERNGEEAAELVGHRLEFAGRRFHITAQGRIVPVHNSETPLCAYAAIGRAVVCSART
jgi:hypothetical protein